MTKEDQEKFLEDMKNEAAYKSMLPEEYFLKHILELLEYEGLLSQAETLEVNKTYSGNKTMRFDAYALDDRDNAVCLIYNDFTDNLDATINNQDIETYKKYMLNFLNQAISNKIKEYFDITDDVNRIANQIVSGFNGSLEGNELYIDNIKLFILTNKIPSSRINKIEDKEFNGKKVETYIYHLESILSLYSKEKEEIIIKISDFVSKEIPCILANQTDEYDSYLAVFPAEFIKNIYYKFGTRLLEENVRAFLSNRGKVNKGIRDTILKEPSKFFAYNNGIACTAKNLKTNEHGITEICDLQIINGGQTSASIYFTSTKDHTILDQVFVPVKLNVIKDEMQYETMISNISRYANTQNRIKDSDFFSNHIFHRCLETLSKQIKLPQKQGEIFSSKYYYERSRGKWENEYSKLEKKEQKNFLREYPKNQIIKKEELAKYYVCSILMRPDIVCKGSEKAMMFFAECINDKLKEDEYNTPSFWKKMIAISILYRNVDVYINKSNWYNKGGYKSQIVTYSIAKFFSLIPNNYSLDFEMIFNNNSLPSKMLEQIGAIAEKTNQFIRNTEIIVTEYAKKESCWNSFKNYYIDIKIENTEEYLINSSFEKQNMSSQIRENKRNKKIDMETETINNIINKGSSYWQDLLDSYYARLAPNEVSLLQIAINAQKRPPTPKQAQDIMNVEKILKPL